MRALTIRAIPTPSHHHNNEVAMARIVKLAMSRTVVVALGTILALCVATPARAAHVTGVSLSGSSLVGNSKRTITATITVAFEQNENLFFDGQCCITSVFAYISGPGLFGNTPGRGN